MYLLDCKKLGFCSTNPIFQSRDGGAYLFTVVDGLCYGVNRHLCALEDDKLA